VTFRAERDVLVAVASCSAASGNEGGPRPLGVEITPAGSDVTSAPAAVL
jgi:uncharacterized protein YcgI (DUF1989 family)